MYSTRRSSNSSREFSCKCNPKFFCYICGLFNSSNQLRTFTQDLKKLYEDYFGFAYNPAHENKPWTPSSVCITCSSNLHKWNTRKLALIFLMLFSYLKKYTQN